ncbi:MAG: DUF2878 family protein [Bdellovibrionales bacterium]
MTAIPAILFNFFWFAYVYSASMRWYFLIPAALILFLFIVQKTYKPQGSFWRKVLLLTAMGFMFDVVMHQLGVIDLDRYATMAICACWLSFSSLFIYNYATFKKLRYVMLVLFGFFGPFSYYIAFKMEALAINKMEAFYVSYAIFWLLFSALLLFRPKVSGWLYSARSREGID